jgi:hypothetical protein
VPKELWHELPTAGAWGFYEGSAGMADMDLINRGEFKLVFPASEWALRWMKEPEFEVKRAAFGQAVARLQQGASAAATTLLKTMIDPGTPASVRVRAVRRARARPPVQYRF